MQAVYIWIAIFLSLFAIPVFTSKTPCSGIEETHNQCVIEIKALTGIDVSRMAKTEDGLFNLCNMSSKAISCMESFAKKCGYDKNEVYNSLTKSIHDLVNQFCKNLSVSDCNIEERHNECRNTFQKESVHLTGSYEERKVTACFHLKEYQKCVNEYFETRCGSGIIEYFHRNVFKPMSRLHIYTDCLPQDRYECELKHRKEVMHSCANVMQYSGKKLSPCQEVNQYRRCAMIKFTKNCRPETAMEYVDSKLPIAKRAEFNRCIHGSASSFNSSLLIVVASVVAAKWLMRSF